MRAPLRSLLVASTLAFLLAVPASHAQERVPALTSSADTEADATETRGKADATRVASNDPADSVADDAAESHDGADATDEVVAGIEAAPVASSTASLPKTVALHAAYPNPFTRTATLTVDFLAATHLTVTVYDLLGRTVATLADGTTKAGSHALTLDAATLSSGVHVVRMTTAEGDAQTPRLILVR